LRLAKLTPLFGALLLTACYGAPTPPQQAFALLPRTAGWGDGVDLAADSSAMVDDIAANRVDFVARYYREPDSRWPALSAGEAQLLSSRGLKIVAIWEAHSADPWHFSYASGYHDAAAAYAEARAIGQPPGTAIYFAVDFNARSWDLGAIDEYFRGIAAGLAAANGGAPFYAVGVYGSGFVCQDVKGTGLARYSWLSNSVSWDGSGSYDDWNILQGEESAALGFDIDSDQARGEYGAFRVPGFALGGSGPPVPVLPPLPAPKPVPAGQQLISANLPPN
jgi:Domain of unknown function (DUF1906)